MPNEKTYYSLEADQHLVCHKCGVHLIKGNAVFEYLDNAFPVELPICPQCGFIYVPEELAMGRVLSVEKVLEDK